MRDVFVETLERITSCDNSVILMTGDLGFGVFDNYRKKFPNQFINAGIAEQGMTLLATGMALEGHKVFTYSIGNFPTLRCLEMIRNDAAYHGANVKIVCVGGGFSYGPLGISHHATEDLAIMRVLPDVTCLAPTNLWETERATEEIYNRDGTCYLRLDKDQGVQFSDESTFILGEPRRLKSGKSVAFFVTGGILSEVVSAVDILEGRFGITCSIYSVHTLKPFIPDTLIDAANNHELIVSVEEHTILGGLGSLLLENFSDKNLYPKKFLRVGLNQCFSSVVGSQKYLRKHFEIDGASIVNRVMDSLHETNV